MLKVVNFMLCILTQLKNRERKKTRVGEWIPHIVKESEKSHCKGYGYKRGDTQNNCSLGLGITAIFLIDGKHLRAERRKKSQHSLLTQGLSTQTIPQLALSSSGLRLYNKDKKRVEIKKWECMRPMLAMIGNSNVDSELVENGSNFGVLF